MDDVSPEPAGWAARLRAPTALVCFALAGGLLAWSFNQRAPSIARASAPHLQTRAAGQLIPKGADLNALALRIAADWGAEPLAIDLPGLDPLTGTRRSLGAGVDVDHLASLLRQATDSTSPARLARARAGHAGDIDVALPIELDDSVLFGRLADLKDAFDQRPVDARADLETGAVSAHQDGRLLDVHGTLDAVYDALRAREPRVAAIVRRLPAARATSDFADLDLSATLGHYETRYSQSADARDRTYNLRVAASKIHGHVVLPGEVFDFNEQVGERSEANGFRPAPVIAGGELVDGVGGGTCQVAGTLHAAVFFAGLTVEERQPHSRPSSYIFMGLDAVVSYPSRNFRFRNDLDVPVAIGFTVEGGIARAEIRAASRERLVTFVRRIDEIAPYTEREVPDAELPSGVRVVRQRGVPGFTVTRWRIVRDLARNQARREHFEDVYPPTTQVVRVGTGGAPAEGYVAPTGDTHAEYTADEYLEASQGAGVRGTPLIRRAGRTGSYGWTERLGFPQP